MTEKMRESLSALMDDEADELELRRVLDGISNDEALRQTWVRYNAVRHVTAGHELAFRDFDVSGRVQAAIAGDRGAAGGGFRERLVRPLVSFGVAASVAATVVFGGQQLASVGVDDPYDSQQAVAARPSPVGMVNSLGATTVRASYGTQAVPALQPATRTAYRELARQRLGKYMQEHAEHAALNSPQGLILFARVPEIRE